MKNILVTKKRECKVLVCKMKDEQKHATLTHSKGKQGTVLCRIVLDKLIEMSCFFHMTLQSPLLHIHRPTELTHCKEIHSYFFLVSNI